MIDWRSARLTRSATVVIALAMTVMACGSEASMTLMGDTSHHGANAAPLADPSEPSASMPMAHSEPTPVPAVTPAATATAVPATSAPPDSDSGDDTGPKSASDPSEAVAAPANDDQGDGHATAVTVDGAGWGGLPVVATGGATGSYRGYTFWVHGTVATDLDPESVIAQSPQPGDDHLVITEVTVLSQARGGDLSFGQSDFALEDPAGQRISSSYYLDRSGDVDYSIYASGPARLTLAVVFESDAADLSGYNLVFGTSAVPLRLPLSGAEYGEPYPLALADGQASVLEGESPNCTAAAYDVVVSSAQVDIAASDGSKWHYPPEGERTVKIKLRLSGRSSDAESYCEFSPSWPGFPLYVDGRPFEVLGDTVPSIDGRASGEVTLVYQIPRTAQAIELIGGHGEQVLAKWQLDLPAAVGESDGPRNPGAVETGMRQPRPAWGPYPAEPESIELSVGGADGSILRFEFEVGSTTAVAGDVDAFIAGEAKASDETWLVTELGIELTDAELSWLFGRSNLMLIDPHGHAHAADGLYDRLGANFFEHISELEYHLIRVAFPTDGLVADLAGWSIAIQDDYRTRPLVLPLVGPAPDPSFPIVLQPGAQAEIAPDYEIFGCAQPRLDIEVNNAWLDIERGVRTRVRSGQVLVEFELMVTNLSPESNCRHRTVAKDLLLDVDGWPTNVARIDGVTIAAGDTATVNLTFLISADSESITLVGADLSPIASWALGDIP